VSRVIKKWAIIWPVDFSNNVNKTYWVFFGSYYELQEYKYWNDWQEGVGNHWKWSWKCVKQFKHEEK
jgi:hypothetical protein